jgi:hypothetical protein
MARPERWRGAAGSTVGGVTAVVELQLAGSSEPWEAIGLRVVDARAWVGNIALRFVAPEGDAPQLVGWTLAGSPTTPASIDGIATTYDDELEVEAWEHSLGAVAFDHVVVSTNSLDRTCGAISDATGEPLKRVRDLGAIRQGFHRLGPMIVEVVESDRTTADIASLWGFVFNVADLHDTADRLGPDLLSPPKAAVQPGRYIASFRPAARLGLPIALMSV